MALARLEPGVTGNKRHPQLELDTIRILQRDEPRVTQVTNWRVRHSQRI